MRLLAQLFENNRAWASALTRQNPSFFQDLSKQQAPEYLWIGCSDSRVPASQIVGLLPGQMFVHRNVANLVLHSDFNCLSAMQFAIDKLGIRHVIVCGHYGCGGVLAVLRNEKLGLIDNWLRPVEDVKERHSSWLNGLDSEQQRHNTLCELNVVQQVVNAAKSTIVREAWAKGREVAIHGWIYGLHDGLLRDLGITVTGESEISAMADAAKDKLHARPID
jgi:carbonic anhydrase